MEEKMNHRKEHSKVQSSHSQLSVPQLQPSSSQIIYQQPVNEKEMMMKTIRFMTPGIKFSRSSNKLLGNILNFKEHLSKALTNNQRDDNQAWFLYEYMKSFKFFRQFLPEEHVDQEIIIKICKSLRYEKHKKGEAIYLEGEPSNGKIYMLYTGRVSVCNKRLDVYEQENLIREERATSMIINEDQIESLFELDKKFEPRNLKSTANLIFTTRSTSYESDIRILAPIEPTTERRRAKSRTLFAQKHHLPFSHQPKRTARLLNHEKGGKNNIDHENSLDVELKDSETIQVTSNSDISEISGDKVTICENSKTLHKSNLFPSPKPSPRQKLEINLTKLTIDNLNSSKNPKDYEQNKVEINSENKVAENQLPRINIQSVDDQVQPNHPHLQGIKRGDFTPIAEQNEIYEATPMAGYKKQNHDYGYVKHVIIERGNYFGDIDVEEHEFRSSTVYSEVDSDFLVLTHDNFEYIRSYYDRDQRELVSFLMDHMPMIDKINNKAILKSFTQLFEIKCLEKGSCITTEGSNGDYVYILYKGRAEVYRSIDIHEQDHSADDIRKMKHFFVGSTPTKEKIHITNIEVGTFVGEEIIPKRQEKSYLYTVKVISNRAQVLNIHKTKLRECLMELFHEKKLVKDEILKEQFAHRKIEVISDSMDSYPLHTRRQYSEYEGTINQKLNQKHHGIESLRVLEREDNHQTTHHSRLLDMPVTTTIVTEGPARQRIRSFHIPDHQNLSIPHRPTTSKSQDMRPISARDVRVSIDSLFRSPIKSELNPEIKAVAEKLAEENKTNVNNIEYFKFDFGRGDQMDRSTKKNVIKKFDNIQLQSVQYENRLKPVLNLGENVKIQFRNRQKSENQFQEKILHSPILTTQMKLCIKNGALSARTEKANKIYDTESSTFEKKHHLDLPNIHVNKPLPKRKLSSPNIIPEKAFFKTVDLSAAFVSGLPNNKAFYTKLQYFIKSY